MEMKHVKKCLLQEKIRITYYAVKQMEKRGYTLSDVISCIWNGEINEHQLIRGNFAALVEGSDMDSLPIVLVIGQDKKNRNGLVLVSVFPPIKKKFKRVI